VKGPTTALLDPIRQHVMRGTNMAGENAVRSGSQNDVEACLAERASCEASIPVPATAKSTSWLFSTVASRGRKASKSEGPNDDFEDIIGARGALREVLELVRTVAATDSTALIEGETGTGKELIARAIHEHSTRRNRPFLKVNCAAIPLGLLESELFGHERGAFTGAVMRKVGRFEAASQGTLFLDEVGDIQPELQPKLLRVLQDGEFERLGSTQTQRANVRLVAATNKDLAKLVARNQFRSDLYYRLNVFPIAVPPLRDRSGDIPLLVMHFVKTYSERTHKQIEFIPTEVMEALVGHSWPGNIRELQNFIERSVILTDGNTLRPPLGELRQNVEINSLKPTTLKEAERHHICKALEQADWVIGGPRGAALRLGLKRSTLYARMQKLGISRATLIAENRISSMSPQLRGDGETSPPNGRLTGETTNDIEVLCDEKGQTKLISCRI
jgi:transcriptional regulator with GAF, ATPase, and Fis domain